jgi:hypothetical protein
MGIYGNLFLFLSIEACSFYYYPFGLEEDCVVVDLHVQYAIGVSLWHRMLLRVLEKR